MLATCLAVFLATPGFVRRAPAQVDAGAPARAAETREQYAARVERELRQLGTKIDELRQKAEAAGGKARDGSRRAVGELRVKKNALERRLRIVETSTGRAWRDLKSGVDEALGDLRKSLEKAKSRFP
jgi:hypothetical protein